VGGGKMRYTPDKTYHTLTEKNRTRRDDQLNNATQQILTAEKQ